MDRPAVRRAGVRRRSPRAIDTYTAILRGEQLAHYEVRIRTKSGGFIVGEFHSAPLVEQGRVVGAQGIARDITDRKRADEIRQVTEERFRTLFESADERCSSWTAPSSWTSIPSVSRCSVCTTGPT